MADLVRCINQVFGSKEKVRTPEEWRPGMGDCTICTYDPINNPRCLGYHPIKIWTINVVESENNG